MEVQISISKILYNNIEILNYSEKTVVYFRLQNYNKALKFFSKLINSILLSINSLVENKAYFNKSTELVDEENLNFILTNILEAQENKDYILLADLLELQLDPFIIKLQEIIVTNEEIPFDSEQYYETIKLLGYKYPNLEKQLIKMSSPIELFDKGYSVEYTSCGLLTLALNDNGKKYYLHSNGQVFHEAGVLAREWFSNDIADYIIYGLGFGYHVTELLELDDSITINVYESDINIIQLACAFSNVKQLLSNERVNIIYDPQFSNLNQRTNTITDETKYIIHYPSLRNIKNKKDKEYLEDYFMTYSSINNQLHSLNNNFRKNIFHYDSSIDILREEFYGKDLYIVAAGPSLDNNYLRLKEVNNNSIILATGTVLKKLLKAGIKPDYVIIIDANDLVYQQIEGIEDEKIPLLFLSTVYHKIPENYKGYKYLICQEGFKKSEEYALKNGFQLYKTGGSVSTIALDIGIQFECKRITFLGLDLAFTNKKDHASDIPSLNSIDTTGYRQVYDINGNKVATGKNLDIYRKWIENRILNVQNIEIVDATEGGARIKGMKIKTMSEIIHSF